MSLPPSPFACPFLIIAKEALRDCVGMGLAMMERDFVTGSLLVQEASPEWLDLKAFPNPEPIAS
jgi:hypothetical protein